ncbi:hypothetical protein [Actinoplanes solisilvae]|uniref:hypothetical protein n=1 Tax=Actinoplanes solisilvae TaxID=2486853 RepID=UPI000FDA1009|nr:hypothetical protein [Actinoplanes solisilvae]
MRKKLSAGACLAAAAVLGLTPASSALAADPDPNAPTGAANAPYAVHPGGPGGGDPRIVVIVMGDVHGLPGAHGWPAGTTGEPGGPQLVPPPGAPQQAPQPGAPQPDGPQSGGGQPAADQPATTEPGPATEPTPAATEPAPLPTPTTAPIDEPSPGSAADTTGPAPTTDTVNPEPTPVPTDTTPAEPAATEPAVTEPAATEPPVADDSGLLPPAGGADAL